MAASNPAEPRGIRRQGCAELQTKTSFPVTVIPSAISSLVSETEMVVVVSGITLVGSHWVHNRALHHSTWVSDFSCSLMTEPSGSQSGVMDLRGLSEVNMSGTEGWPVFCPLAQHPSSLWCGLLFSSAVHFFKESLPQMPNVSPLKVWSSLSWLHPESFATKQHFSRSCWNKRFDVLENFLVPATYFSGKDSCIHY